MVEIKKQVIVPYTPAQMFGLVHDIANYPKYLPWCTHVDIRENETNYIVGAVYLEYLKVKTHFVTKNVYYPNEKIDLELVDGPFKVLCGSWDFTPLGDKGCKINFVLHYEFANAFLDKLIGPVFSYISKNIVDCFIKEAHKKYKV